MVCVMSRPGESAPCQMVCVMSRPGESAYQPPRPAWATRGCQTVSRGVPGQSGRSAMSCPFRPADPPRDLSRSCGGSAHGLLSNWRGWWAMGAAGDDEAPLGAGEMRVCGRMSCSCDRRRWVSPTAGDGCTSGA
jgi:hypothetical protein